MLVLACGDRETVWNWNQTVVAVKLPWPPSCSQSSTLASGSENSPDPCKQHFKSKTDLNEEILQVELVLQLRYCRVENRSHWRIFDPIDRSRGRPTVVDLQRQWWYDFKSKVATVKWFQFSSWTMCLGCFGRNHPILVASHGHENMKPPRERCWKTIFKI